MKKNTDKGKVRNQDYPDTPEGWAASNRLAAMLVMEGATVVRPYGPFPKKTKNS
jgi:hypothetical protein